MTKHKTAIDMAVEELMSEGTITYEEFLEELAGETMGTLNTEHATFETGKNITLHLKPIPVMVINFFTNDETGKPEVPVVEVTYAGGVKAQEANPNDPAYIQAMQAYHRKKIERQMMYCFVEGVVNQVPDDFVKRYVAYGITDPTKLKYLYVVEACKGEDELGELFTAIIEQTSITENGMREAQDRFQR